MQPILYKFSLVLWWCWWQKRHLFCENWCHLSSEILF